MRQIKLFKGVEMELEDLEATVNNWIQENSIQVERIEGNIAPQTFASPGQARMSGSDVLILVQYEI